MAPKGYPPEVRAAALIREREVGPVQAAEELGIAPSTIIEWRQRNELPVSLALDSESKLRVATRLEAVRNKAIEVEELLLDRIKEEIDNIPAKDLGNTLKNVAIHVGINSEHANSQRHGYDARDTREQQPITVQIVNSVLEPGRDAKAIETEYKIIPQG